MWKDRAIVGRAVGIKTVSSATKKIDKQRAINARTVESDGLERFSGVVSMAVLFGANSDVFGMFPGSKTALLYLDVMFVADARLGAVETEPLLYRFTSN
jgi:phosphoribulokinase